METQSIPTQPSVATAPKANSAAPALGGDDFFKLMIAQLTNQDPLEPTSNQDLLNQISSIREIELTTTLSDSLKSLTDQQRFASAASMIGQFVNGRGESNGENGVAVSGTVVAVRFDPTGKAILELEDGSRIPLDKVDSIMDGQQAAESLVGKFVTGVDRTDPANLRLVEGIVTKSSTNDAGEITLELDTGEALRLTDVISAANDE